MQRARKRASFEERKQKRMADQLELQPAKPAKKAKSDGSLGLTKPQLVRTVAFGGHLTKQTRALREAVDSVGEARVWMRAQR